jgi:hypothetical protein
MCSISLYSQIFILYDIFSVSLTQKECFMKKLYVLVIIITTLCFAFTGCNNDTNGDLNNENEVLRRALKNYPWITIDEPASDPTTVSIFINDTFEEGDCIDGHLVVGRGVTLILKGGGNFSINYGGIVDIEEGAAMIVEADNGLIVTNQSMLNVYGRLDIDKPLAIGGALSLPGNLKVAGLLNMKDNTCTLNNGVLAVDSGGTLNITNGKLTIEDHGELSVNSGGILNIDKSTLDFTTGTASPGKLIIQEGGTLNINEESELLVQNRPMEVKGRLNIDKGELTVTPGGARLAVADTGRVDVENGGKIDLDDLNQLTGEGTVSFSEPSEFNVTIIDGTNVSAKLIGSGEGYFGLESDATIVILLSDTPDTKTGYALNGKAEINSSVFPPGIDCIITNDKTFTLNGGSKLTIPAGKTFVVVGKLEVRDTSQMYIGGTIDNKGAIENEGTITIEAGGTTNGPPPDPLGTIEGAGAGGTNWPANNP